MIGIHFCYWCIVVLCPGRRHFYVFTVFFRVLFSRGFAFFEGKKKIVLASGRECHTKGWKRDEKGQKKNQIFFTARDLVQWIHYTSPRAVYVHLCTVSLVKTVPWWVVSINSVRTTVLKLGVQKVRQTWLTWEFKSLCFCITHTPSHVSSEICSFRCLLHVQSLLVPLTIPGTKF
jgi:hypothetical protein